MINERILCVCIFLITVVVFVSGNTADSFFDGIIRKLKNRTELREMLDPLQIDSVEWKKYELYNISIYNLLNLERSGSAELTFTEGKPQLEASLNVNSLVIQVAYRPRQKRLLGIKGDVWAAIERLVCRIRVTANVLSGSASLVNFEVTEMSPIRVVRLTGVSPVFNKVVGLLVQKIFLHRNRERLRKDIQLRGKEAISKALSTTPLAQLI